MLWAARAGILTVCAIALLLLARKHLAAQAMGSFVVPVALGVGLFVLAAWNFVRIAKQLRVFFGRGQPVGMAPELDPDKVGLSDSAKALMQTVRQGTLEFDIPGGALNGVFYSLVKHLISAPAYIQNVLQNRFSNLASYGFLLVIMLVAMMFVGDTLVLSWVGAFFLCLVVFAVQFNPMQDWKPVMGFATPGLSLVAVGVMRFAAHIGCGAASTLSPP